MMLPVKAGYRPVVWYVLVTLGVSLVSSALFAESVAPFVPTVREDVELMLDLAEVKPEDHVMDLGSGDGRIVISAAQLGARAHGIELDADLVDFSMELAAELGVSDKASFATGDIFEADISAASVVMLYLFPEANIRLRPKLLSELRPGTRVVSNSFHMGDWRPDREARGRTSGGAMLWVIPADFSGRWHFQLDSASYELEVTQQYQDVSVLLTEDGRVVTIERSELSGDYVTIDTGGMTLQGNIRGDEISGEVVYRGNRAPGRWSAGRIRSDERDK